MTPKQKNALKQLQIDKRAVIPARVGKALEDKGYAFKNVADSTSRCPRGFGRYVVSPDGEKQVIDS